MSDLELQTKKINMEMSKPENKLEYDKFCLRTQKPLLIGIVVFSFLVFILQFLHFSLKQEYTEKLTQEEQQLDKFNQKLLCIMYGSIALISSTGGLTTLLVIPKYLNIFQSIYQIVGYVAIILVTYFCPKEQKGDDLYNKMREINTYLIVIQQITITPFYSNQKSLLIITILSLIVFITTAIFIENQSEQDLVLTIPKHMPAFFLAVYFSHWIRQLLIQAFCYEVYMKQKINFDQFQALDNVQDAIILVEQSPNTKIVDANLGNAEWVQDRSDMSQNQEAAQFNYSEIYKNECTQNFFGYQQETKTNQFLNARCFRSLKDTGDDDEQAAHQMLLEEPDYYTLQNNQILTSKDLGQSVHSIEEIMQMIPFDKESDLFCFTIKVKVPSNVKNFRGQNLANQQFINRIVRIKKNQLINNDQEVIMITIKDYSDSVLCKKIHLQNDEDIRRIEIINSDINSIISRNKLNLKNVQSSFQGRSEDQYAQEKADKIHLQYLQTKMSGNNHDLTSLFFQMKDLVDLRKNQLLAHIEQEFPEKFFKKLQKSIQKELVDVEVCFDIQADTLAEKMISEWKRIEYILQRLVKNAIQRTKIQREIGICCFVAKSGSEIFEQLQNSCSLNNNCYGYLVCEVQDFGEILTQSQIKDIFSPPKLETIQDQGLLKLNLSNYKVITNAINAKLYAHSDQQKGTTFCLAVPVKIPPTYLNQIGQVVQSNNISSIHTENLQTRQGGTLNYQLSLSSSSVMNTQLGGLQRGAGANVQLSANSQSQLGAEQNEVGYNRI